MHADAFLNEWERKEEVITPAPSVKNSLGGSFY